MCIGHQKQMENKLTQLQAKVNKFQGEDYPKDRGALVGCIELLKPSSSATKKTDAQKLPPFPFKEKIPTDIYQNQGIMHVGHTYHWKPQAINGRGGWYQDWTPPELDESNHDEKAIPWNADYLNVMLQDCPSGSSSSTGKRSSGSSQSGSLNKRRKSLSALISELKNGKK